MNVLIPMAGEGSRFAKAGYTFPKPLIEIFQKPMIQLVVENLSIEAKFIFLVRKEHDQKYNVSSLLKVIAPNCEIVIVDKLTEGAACTTLLAEDYIDKKDPLIIANSDQFLEWNSSKVLYEFTNKKLDGGIIVFNSLHPKWSYAKTDENDIVTEVAEKTKKAFDKVKTGNQIEMDIGGVYGNIAGAFFLFRGVQMKPEWLEQWYQRNGGSVYIPGNTSCS